MLNFIRIIIASLLFACVGIANADEYRVTANNLNVRLLPGTYQGSNVIARLNRGDLVEVTNFQIASGWSGIRLSDGRQGFVSSKFLERVRIDAFNADFLQLLPGSDRIQTTELIDDYGRGGLDYKNRAAVTESGRFAAISGSKNVGLRLVDTKIGRVTRMLRPKQFAMTNQYLAYMPEVGVDYIETIDLSSTDIEQKLDPSNFGQKSFRSLIPVPDSDIILVNSFGDGRKIVSSNLLFIDIKTGEQIGSELVLEKTSNGKVYGYSLFKLSNRIAVAYRSGDRFDDRSARIFFIDLVDRRIISEAPLDDDFGLIFDLVVTPDEEFAIFQMSIDSEGIHNDEIVAGFDINQGVLMWSKRVGYFDIESTNTTINDQVVVVRPDIGQPGTYLDVFTGNEVGAAPKPDYGDFSAYKKRELSFRSNGGSTTLSVLGYKPPHNGFGRQTTFTIEHDGEKIANWAQVPIQLSFMDIVDDGKKLRAQIGKDGASQHTFFEWDLTLPSPTATPVPGNVAWISEANSNGERTVAWALQETGGAVTKETDVSALIAPKANDTKHFSCGPEGPQYQSDAEIMPTQVHSMAGELAFVGRKCVVTRPNGVHPRYMEANLDKLSVAKDPGGAQGFCDFQRGIACNAPQWRLEQRWLNYQGTFIKLQKDGQSDVWVETFQLPTGAELHQSAKRIAGFKLQKIADLFEEDGNSTITIAPPPGNGNLRLIIKAKRHKKAGPWLIEMTTNGDLVSDPVELSATDFFDFYSPLITNGTWFAQMDSDFIRIWNSAFENKKKIRVPESHDHESRIRIGKDVLVYSVSPIEHRIYGLAEGKLRATFFFGSDGEAVALTPEGFFSQNKPGAAASIIVRNRVNGDSVPLTAVFDSLYRPDLVAQALQGDPEGLVKAAGSELNLATVIGVGPAPVPVAVDFSDDGSSGSVLARARIEIGSGGFAQAVWRVNDVVVGIEQNTTNGSRDGEVITLTRRLPMIAGENIVSIQLTNSESSIYSDELTKVITVKKTQVLEPQLYVFAIGVDQYETEDLKLNYSVADANAISDVFAQNAKGYANVIVHTLTDGEVTKESVADKFLEISETIEPDDTFVFYLAGHGVTHDGRYYFLPPNVTVDDEIDVTLAKFGISQNDWQKMLSSIAALKALVVFDSCESGSAVRMDGADQLEQGTSIEKLSRSSGRAVMTAASENQFAMEGYEGHGAFTYTLLQAFERGDANNDKRLKLSELAEFVKERLPSITEEKWAYRQEPQIAISGTDFNVAILD